MTRYRLKVEYDGGPFVGFQAQARGRSVQSAIQGALTAFCGEEVTIRAAGRTDAGVHALGQVVHFDLAREWPPQVVMDALNAHLPPDPIAIVEAERASSDFDARFSATGRTYFYRVLDRRAPPTVTRGRVWHVRRPLRVEAMADAAAALLGRHDFTTFRDSACQARSPVRTLDLASIQRAGEEVRLTFAARSFLHRQVRSMVGALVQVGLGRWSADDLAAALAARDRARCAPVAPAAGLALLAVDYAANREK